MCQLQTVGRLVIRWIVRDISLHITLLYYCCALYHYVGRGKDKHFSICILLTGIHHPGIRLSVCVCDCVSGFAHWFKIIEVTQLLML